MKMMRKISPFKHSQKHLIKLKPLMKSSAKPLIHTRKHITAYQQRVHQQNAKLIEQFGIRMIVAMQNAWH